jgi:hypothetical protein
MALGSSNTQGAEAWHPASAADLLEVETVPSSHVIISWESENKAFSL